MEHLVRICALFNAAAVLAFITPGVLPAIGVEPPPSLFWSWLPALALLFGAVALWLSAADLRRLAAFPYWNGLIRILFAVAAFRLDFAGSAGQPIALIAVLDLVLGLACVLGLPRALGRTHLQLLTNRGND